jgi:hypothetical protein
MLLIGLVAMYLISRAMPRAQSTSAPPPAGAAAAAPRHPAA